MKFWDRVPWGVSAQFDFEVRFRYLEPVGFDTDANKSATILSAATVLNHFRVLKKKNIIGFRSFTSFQTTPRGAFAGTLTEPISITFFRLY